MLGTGRLEWWTLFPTSAGGKLFVQGSGIKLLVVVIFMERKERIVYWLEIAHYDLLTAKAMLETKRYLYVGFYVTKQWKNV